jgi:hypothetical protein
MQPFRIGWKPARVVLFIFKESYVVLLIEQIWSYIDSTLDPKAAKRLNGPICGVAGIGAVTGGLVLGQAGRSRSERSTCCCLGRGDRADGAVLYKLLFARFGAPSEGKKKQQRPPGAVPVSARARAGAADCADRRDPGYLDDPGDRLQKRAARLSAGARSPERILGQLLRAHQRGRDAVSVCLGAAAAVAFSRAG